MSWKKSLAIAAFTAALAAPPAVAQLAEGVVAIVNDAVISTYDVRQRANLLLISAGVQSTPDIMRQAQIRALQDLVDESLKIQEAGTFNIAINPAEIDRRLNDIARSNNATLDQFAAELGASGVGLSTLRRQIEADIAWSRLINGLYGSRLRISEQTITETQERLAANALRPQYLISEIFLPANTPQEVQELQRGAVGLLQQMQQGAPFPMVARQFSAAASAAAGGDVGWMTANDLPPEVRPALDALEPGQVSMPIATQNGVYIIALRDRRQGLPQGSTTRVTLQQITAPASSRAALERAQRRISSCNELQSIAAGVDGAQVVDLGEASEADLSPALRERIGGVEAGGATDVAVAGETASTFVVCQRVTAGGGLPSRDELQAQLQDRELDLLAERYLRNLRREATIITR